MNSTDLWLVGTAFLAGAGIASAVWWLWSAFAGADPPGRAPDPEPSGPRAARRRPNGYLRTSQRVLLHLSHQPRLTYGDVAPVELTQAGMSRALGVSQPALARVLRRLIDGEAVLEMRTHVRGDAKRLKVYQLTVHGEAIARDLRGRVPPTAPERSAPPTAASASGSIAEPVET